MKRIFMALICVGFFAGSALAAEDLKFTDENDKTSYSVGYQIGGDFKRQGVQLNPEALVRGIKDAVSDAKPVMTEQEMSQLLVELKRKIVAAQEEVMKKLAEENIAKSDAFLAENAKKDGVKTLASGLQYKIVKEGAGGSPKATDTVTVHYRGTLIDGTEFDSSYSRNQPATFQLNRVIPGWLEALQLMNPGSKWQVFIPPKLAYGEHGAAPRIPPNSTLIFEVELLSIGEVSGSGGTGAEPAKKVPAEKGSSKPAGKKAPAESK
jgi:FKBP-type peptidyl-prolyl cis-trans isomerase FklB